MHQRTWTTTKPKTQQNVSTYTVNMVVDQILCDDRLGYTSRRYRCSASTRRIWHPVTSSNISLALIGSLKEQRPRPDKTWRYWWARKHNNKSDWLNPDGLIGTELAIIILFLAETLLTTTWPNTLELLISAFSLVITLFLQSWKQPQIWCLQMGQSSDTISKNWLWHSELTWFVYFSISCRLKTS